MPSNCVQIAFNRVQSRSIVVKCLQIAFKLRSNCVQIAFSCVQLHSIAPGQRSRCSRHGWSSRVSSRVPGTVRPPQMPEQSAGCPVDTMSLWERGIGVVPRGVGVVPRGVGVVPRCRLCRAGRTRSLPAPLSLCSGPTDITMGVKSLLQKIMKGRDDSQVYR